MADKLAPGIAVTPTFTDGESPSSAKLGSISAQMKFAAQQLELAVGDAHGQSWPYLPANTTKLTRPWGRDRLADTALTTAGDRLPDIVNLSRLIGPASNLNPRTLSAGNTITETVPTGRHEFSLRRNPTTSPVFSDSTVFATPTSGALDTDGKYNVDSKGRIFTALPTAGGTVTYDTVPFREAGAMGYQGATFNVIPDTNQLTAGGLGLSFGVPDAQGRRLATLPLATHQQSNYDGDSIVLTSADPNFNVQLELPRVLSDSLVTGDEIPEGFLFIKNYTTGEVYETATYLYNSSTTVLMGGVDITAEITAGDLFSVITVGTDITTSIDDLRVKSNHTHDRTFGEPLIGIEDIADVLRYAGESGRFERSDTDSNFMPQYLHRDGHRTGFDDANSNDGNAMRGDLLIGISAGTPTTYMGAGLTHRLFFGGNLVSTSSASIYRNANEQLVLEDDNLCTETATIVLSGATSSGGGYFGSFIASSVSSLSLVVSQATAPVHPLVITGTIAATGVTGETIALNLSTLSTTIAHVLVSVGTSVGATQFIQPGGKQAGFDFQLVAHFDTATEIVTLTLIGADYPAGDLPIKIVVFSS